VALGALGATLAGAAWAGVDAWRVAPPPAPAAVEVGGFATLDPRPMGVSEDALLAALDADLFARERAGDGAPPEEVDAGTLADDGASEAPAPAPVLPALRLLGVVLHADGGGSAALASSTGEMQLVRVGQRYGGWLLRAVERGSATLAGADTMIVLRIGGANASRGGS
jgi:hypothetical protein